ncbi:MAG: alpha/beta hydrolase-fold protein [Acidobacteriota bacterium]
MLDRLPMLACLAVCLSATLSLPVAARADEPPRVDVLRTAEPSRAIGHSRTIRSRVLGTPDAPTERSVRIYLPPSYSELRSARYPVLYMVDGDYSFHYVTGLIEQMSSISEQIPEMIFVALDDGGKTAYRQQMAPSIGEAPGDASLFLRYLEDEVIPLVETEYQTAGYRGLVGHSMGGLFTVAALLEKPSLFDVYIAISPSLWWQEQALVAHAETVFGAAPELEARLYVTVADERGMGVLGFADLLDRAAPPGLLWRFERHLDENHGSVGVPTLRTALRADWGGFALSGAEFRAATGAEAIIGRYRALAERLDTDFLLPPRVLGQIVGAYRRDGETEQITQLEASVAEHFPLSLPLLHLALAADHAARDEHREAAGIYGRLVEQHRTSYTAWSGLALAQAALGDREALTSIGKALIHGEASGARQWQINQLWADRKRVDELLREPRPE